MLLVMLDRQQDY